MSPVFKKGQAVWEFGSWDDKGTWFYRLLTIQSWGKKQGTASFQKDGKMTKALIYVESANSKSYCAHYFSVDAVTNPAVIAEQLARIYLDARLADRTLRLGHKAYHQATILRDIETLSTATPKALAI